MPLHPTRVLFAPPTEELRFLPEGPYPIADGKFSWVAIAHGRDSIRGSLNLFDCKTGSNQSYALPGRPGFARPTDSSDWFLVGLERTLGLFQLSSSRWIPVCQPVDQDVEGTIINDACTWGDYVVFGTKDLKFESPKASLYAWRPGLEKPMRLTGGQTCSNGKGILVSEADGCRLLDIDTPTRQIASYPIDLQSGTLGSRSVALDLTHLSSFPDGMILCDQGRMALISFYDPFRNEPGETKLYRLADGECLGVWQTDLAPQATCPQIISWEGHRHLVITTAVEWMAEDRYRLCPNSGSIFIAPWDHAEPSQTPPYEVAKLLQELA
ncbi:MAG: SMP-30/gluconolactonase/LRE family protein [Pirellulaceae bacterium]|jgi:sugar lactone lactonase YvrE